jgi:transcriptional regulator with XRE-family HTH domain
VAQQPPIHVFIGKAARALRAEKGISQDELARRSGIHRTYAGTIERAEKVMSVEKLEQVAAGFGMRGSELLARAEDLRDRLAPEATAQGAEPPARADDPPH